MPAADVCCWNQLQPVWIKFEQCQDGVYLFLLAYFNINISLNTNTVTVLIARRTC